MSSRERPSISAFFPAYNDGGTIASMVISAILVLETLTDDYEIIVVDDGSADYTGQILDRLAADYERVRVIHHPENRGFGGALRTGFASATKELIFYTDGDAQYNVWDLRRLYPLLIDGIDLVQGYKLNRGDSWLRKIVGQVYHRIVRLMFGLKVRDVDCDFRLMRRRVFEYVELAHDSGAICIELVKKIQDHGLAIVETGVSHYPRVYGRSQFFRPGPLFRTLVGLLSLWVELVLRRKHRNTEAPAGNAHIGAD
jgi:glycosyltransferase involved in cell wall biosynthesis